MISTRKLQPLLMVLCWACGPGEPGTPSPGENGLELLPPPEGQGFQLRVVVEETKPASEIQVCRFIVVPEDMEIERIEHEYKIGGHHLIVYRTNLPKDAVDTGEVKDCGNIAGPLLYTSGSLKFASRWPEGVGMRLKKDEVLQLETHFLNLTTEPQTNDVRVNLWKATRPLTAEAGALFMYDLDIAIPPMGSVTTRMRCEIPQDINILTTFPHAHVRSTGMWAWNSPRDLPRDQVGTASTAFMTSRGYGDLEPRQADPEIRIPGGTYIDFDCAYENKDNVGVVEGPSRDTNEMCLFIAEYYPRLPLDAELCTMPGSGPVHTPGTLSCGQVLGCVTAIPGRDTTYEGQLCWQNACEASQDATRNLQNCLYRHCQGCLGSDCDLCASVTCGEEFGTCQQAGC